MTSLQTLPNFPLSCRKRTCSRVCFSAEGQRLLWRWTLSVSGLHHNFKFYYHKARKTTTGNWGNLVAPKAISRPFFFLWSSKVFTHQLPATIASQSGIYIGAVLLGKVCVTSHENLCIYFVFSLTASSSCIPCEVEGNQHAECEECKAGYLVQGRFRGIWRQMNVIYIKHTGVLGCN